MHRNLRQQASAILEALYISHNYFKLFYRWPWIQSEYVRLNKQKRPQTAYVTVNKQFRVDISIFSL